MKNNKFIKILRKALIVALAVGVAACSDEATKMLPEQVAKEFVEAVYNKKDIKSIKSHSTEKIADIVNHYRSIKMIQRHIMDLSLDKATIEVSDVGGDFFRKTRKDLKVELHISGKYNGGFVADDRFLLMTHEDGRWKVKRVSKS
jgi:hypothetical protein